MIGPCCNGTEPDEALDNNGSLASPHILDYGAALATDLLQNYPEINGIRIDWPEIPPYFWRPFSPILDRMWSNLPRIMVLILKVSAVWPMIPANAFGSLTDKDLEAFIETPELLISDLRINEERAKLKTSIVANLLQRFRNAMDAAGGKEKL